MDFIDKIFGSLGQVNFVELELEGEIAEEEEKSLLPSIGTKKRLTLWDIERIISGIESNPQILGIVVKITDLRIGFARANLIRSRLQDLRVLGKKVIVYFESGGNVEYLIASCADSIYVSPWSMLNLIGLKAEVSFYKDVLDKIGVQAHMKGFGEYKSASETFTRDSMSKPNKEMINSILGDLENQLEQYITLGRNIDSKKVKALVDQGPYLAQRALEASLVDGVLYESDLDEKASELAGAKAHFLKAGKFLRRLKGKDMLRSILGKFSRSYPSVAVVADSGMITLGNSRGSGPVKSLGSSSFISLLDKVSQDKSIKAVVIRILSPGGSAVASDLIYKKIEEISENKPVVISMSDVAASGGYLLSLGAKTIVADSMSITGSIGIVSGKFDLSGLYGKLGVTKEFVVKGKNALMYSSSRGFSKDEEKKLLEIMEFYYKEFVGKVSHSRNMNFRDAEKVSKGRVWTGNQAKEHGLIDEAGGINTAIKIAKSQADISPENGTVVKFYSEPRGLQLSSIFKASAILNVFDDFLDGLYTLNREKILTIMPFDIDIK